MVRRGSLIALAGWALAATASAQQAPFCVVFHTGTNCWYYDVSSCREAAGADGACVVNPQRDERRSSQRAPSGGGVWDAFNQGVATGESMAPPPRRFAPKPKPDEANSWQSVCRSARDASYDSLGSGPQDPQGFAQRLAEINATYEECVRL